MAREQPPISTDRIAKFCRDNSIVRLSAAPARMAAANGGGPLELVVDFDPRAQVGLLELVRDERRLSRMLRRKVILVPSRSERGKFLTSERRKLKDLFFAA